MIPENVISTYNQIAELYANEFSTPTDYLDDFLKLLPPKAEILDVGCGSGVDVAYCTQKGFLVEGIDLSEKMVLLARQRNPSARIILADFADYKNLQGYAACIAAYSLIHAKKSSVINVLRNIRSNLKEDGFLYVAFHEGKSEEITITEPLNSALRIFLNIFSETEMMTLLSQTGFHVIETRSRQAVSSEEFPYKKFVIFARAAAQQECNLGSIV